MAAKTFENGSSGSFGFFVNNVIVPFYDFIADCIVGRSFVWPTRQLDAIVAIARLSKTTQKFLRVY